MYVYVTAIPRQPRNDGVLGTPHPECGHTMPMTRGQHFAAIGEVMVQAMLKVSKLGQDPLQFTYEVTFREAASLN